MTYFFTKYKGTAQQQRKTCKLIFDAMSYIFMRKKKKASHL